MRRIALSTIVVVVLAFAQLTLAWHARGVDPHRDYLAPPPSSVQREALAFGDSQFLYRIYCLTVQNAGDTGGRVVPIKNYDFSRVVGWLDTLAAMDPRSDFAALMAEGFFAYSQDVRHVDPIVRFILRNVDADPQRRWRMLLNAIPLVRQRLNDDDLALEAARQLASYEFEGIEVWAALMQAFIFEDQKRYQEARDVVTTAIRRFEGRMSPDDASWTADYLSFLSKVERGEVPPRPLKMR